MRVSVCGLALVAGLGLSRAAKADTITATLETVDPFVGGDLILQGYGDIDGGIGAIVWQGQSTNPSPFNGTFDTYCIDLIEDIYLGQSYTFDTGIVADSPKSTAFPDGNPDGMGAAKADELAELFGQQYALTLPAGNGVDREAFQLAIWNIIYDTDTSVSPGDGTFYATGDVSSTAISIANGFLADAANPGDEALYHADDLITLIGENGAQDQITVDPDITIGTGVPTPSSAMGGAVLMAGYALALVYKRRGAWNGI